MIALSGRSMLSVVIKQVTVSAFIDGVCAGFVCAYQLGGPVKTRGRTRELNELSLDVCYVC